MKKIKVVAVFVVVLVGIVAAILAWIGGDLPLSLVVVAVSQLLASAIVIA